MIGNKSSQRMALGDAGLFTVRRGLGRERVIGEMVGDAEASGKSCPQASA